MAGGVSWPPNCWDRFVSYVARDDYMGANEDFIAFRKAVRAASVAEIEAQSAKAEIVWEFLIGFAQVKPLYRSWIQQVIEKLTQSPSWWEAYEGRSDLRARASTLHAKLQESLHENVTLERVQSNFLERVQSNPTLNLGAMFETPVRRLGVSGGTAPFFKLVLLSPGRGKSVDHWIGKDLAHALDELGFYEQRQALATGTKKTSEGLEAVFSHMFDYAGVFEAPEEGAPEGAPWKRLLVLRNLRDGCNNFRMLDIKIGQQTAAPGWQGKSKRAAMRQRLIDGCTNSWAEGFRLEGFDGRPPALQSQDPLLDLKGIDFPFMKGGLGINPKKICKMALRIMFQRMPAAEMFMHFLDLHHCHTMDDEALRSTFSPTEVAEVVLHQVIGQLTQLVLACHNVLVPQKWIGSSVALGFDDAFLPLRGAAEETIRSKVVVQIFDWGRSELNTVENHASLSAKQKADRETFWAYYVGGINRLAWEAARAYWHRFGNAEGWHEVSLVVYDFDSCTPNDYIGQARVPLQPTDETWVPLINAAGKPVAGRAGPATLAYSVTWRAFPRGARLEGVWRVLIHCGENLPGKNMLDRIRRSPVKSDPFVLITSRSQDGKFSFTQVSSIIVGDVNPVWNEAFEIPVARGRVAFKEPLQQMVNTHSGPSLFPAAADSSANESAVKAALAQWSQFLRNASKR